jgi:hypothetical protein
LAGTPFFPFVRPYNNIAVKRRGLSIITPKHYEGTETILLVEDEEHLRQVCTEVLTRFGYKVLLAGDGKEALALSEGHSGQIDLLLTDVVMPEMNGLELAETLLVSRPGLKVVFISGFPRGMLSPEGDVKPGTVLIAKPFTIKVLMSKLREVLDA